MGKRIENLFREVSTKILDDLSSFREIKAERLNHIKELLSSVTICSGDDFDNITRCYVEVFPTINHINQLSLKITLYMIATKDTTFFMSLLYHEVMHIISISWLYELTNVEYSYMWGICSSKYYIRSDGIYDENFTEFSNLNEALTDLAAEYFYTKHNKKQYVSVRFCNPIMIICNITQIENLNNLIVWYILNEKKMIIDYIKELLFGNGIENVEEILKNI